jgi:hypothetical protein
MSERFPSLGRDAVSVQACQGRCRTGASPCDVNDTSAKGRIICMLSDMQGSLYFPFIGVPPTAWWTRVMLYWDSVGTIVPHAYIRNPELHDPYTLELIRAGLLLQVLPDDAGSSLGSHFGKYLELLSDQEIDRRRRDFAAGHTTRVHYDKWLTYIGGLVEVQRLGLAAAAHSAYSGDWISVETSTAGEFMAALALSLCETAGASGWRSSDRNTHETWVPTTNTREAINALMAGLEPVPQGFLNADRIHMRIQGELCAVEVRTHLMERLLPVPDEVVPIHELAEFRRRHGDLLPGLRRYIESKIDESIAITDPILRSRFMDRIEDEILQRSEEAEAYLNEQGFERVSRSSLLRVLKFIPGLKDPIENAQDIAENLRTSQGFEAEPLAYLAFARVAFGSPTQTYRVDPATGVPLIEAFAEPR